MNRRLVALFVFLICGPGLAAGQTPTAQEKDFFENRIRPVLVEHCYSCHSEKAKKLQGGLRLDTRAGVLKGGDTGPALVPGQPDRSLLLKALRYDGPEMPPKGKLPDTVVADFQQWIAMGAPDPRGEVASAPPTIDFREARRHWAYQPLRRPALPEVRDLDWARTPIDRFILHKLEAKHLKLAALADRRTLLRRTYYDLIGLPPTSAELDAFVNDASPDAFAKVVDRLLASPQYGERWGRHWLDVARYADTKDLVLLFGPDRVRPYAYTYRDYVVRAFNADTPYDRFIHEQLAADQLDSPEPWRLAAMGFLTLGRLFDNNIHDIYDDQIDTVSRGLLGLTVACARCHDHKYDAIPTADYYSFYGVFAGSEAPLEPPLIDDPKNTPGSAEFEAKLAALRQQLQKHIDAQYQQIMETARLRVGDYLLKIATEKPDPLEDAVYYLSLSPDDLKPQITSRWRRYLEKHARAGDLIFGSWQDLMELRDDRVSLGFEELLLRWKLKDRGSAKHVNQRVRQAFESNPPASKADVARLYGDLLKRVYEESKQAEPCEPSSDTRALLDILTSGDGPIYFPKTMTYLYMPRVERGTYGSLLQQMDKLAVTSPGAPPRAMALVDSPQSFAPRVLVRGNPSQPGDRVPRQFLRILSGEVRQPFGNGSGRLDLAKAITAPDNPLASRVIVNRVWMHHFGEPLVATPSDFGTRSSPPTHPELLDYLAWTLQHEDGWSLKKLHRRILLTSTYQMSSTIADSKDGNPQALDPENRLLWRFPRRRLDLEAMRDTLLFVSGRLDRTMGGRPVDVAGDPHNRRRTLYGLVDRQDLPGLFRAFDFAVPDQSVERRPQTTVPQQALFGLNAPFVIEQAKALAARPEVMGGSVAERVTALYRLALLRQPREGEIALALRFLESAGAEGETMLTPWEQLAQVLLLTNELLYVD